MIITKPGDIGEIRFDRPAKKNALTQAALRAIPGAIAALVADGSRVIVLAGSDTVFTAGADLSEFSQSAADLEIEEGLALAAEGLATAPVPVIAAIEGPCLGAGVELAVACDVRIAGESAFFMIPAIRLGLLYRPDGVARLIGGLGPRVTRRLLLLNEQLGPDQIADIVVPDGTALEKAYDLARPVTGYVPDVVAATKRLILEVESAGPLATNWDEMRLRLLADR